MANELKRLVCWYKDHCDGDWEHQNGVHLRTLDNPGWTIDVNLTGTEAAGRTFPVTHVERSQDDWVICEVKKDVFVGGCGPENLAEMIGLFLAFVGVADE